MRLIIRDCSKSTDHALHVSDPRPSMHSCVDGLERFVCPGGRLGDRTIREADDLDDVVRAYDEEHGQTLLVALAEVTGRPIDRSAPTSYDDVEEPDEPDHDEEYEAAERSYERYVY